MADCPRTIARTGSHEIVVRKSRFICTLQRANSEDEARTVIDAVRRKYWDANHNCFAYRIGPLGEAQRSSDDGEPSGTAGVPILAVLTHRDLTNTVAVVTRYFGGTLLGAGGLIRAYGHAVSEAVNVVGIVEIRQRMLVAVEAEHSDAGRLEHALRTASYMIGSITYGTRVEFEVKLDEPDVPAFEIWLAETTNGQSRARSAGSVPVEVLVEPGVPAP